MSPIGSFSNNSAVVSVLDQPMASILCILWLVCAYLSKLKTVNAQTITTSATSVDAFAVVLYTLALSLGFLFCFACAIPDTLVRSLLHHILRLGVQLK